MLSLKFTSAVAAALIPFCFLHTLSAYGLDSLTIFHLSTGHGPLSFRSTADQQVKKFCFHNAKGHKLRTRPGTFPLTFLWESLPGI
jgi:hypothetical protein